MYLQFNDFLLLRLKLLTDGVLSLCIFATLLGSFLLLGIVLRGVEAGDGPGSKWPNGSRHP